VDSETTKNHISPAVVKKMKLLYRQKQNLYPLVMILKDPILYKDNIIHFKTEPVKIEIKRQKLVVLFHVLPSGKDKAVLGMPFL